MRRALPLVLVAVSLTACGSSVKVTADPAQLSVTSVAAAREQAALQKAEKLLRAVALPAGAVRVAHVPRTDQSISYSGLGTSVITMTAERHSFWRVRQSVDSVINFVKAHPVWGLRSFGGSGVPGAESQSVQFSGHGSPMQRQLSIAAARVDGWTYVRVDAGSEWIYPRSPLEVLPAGISEIDIHGGGVSRDLTDPAQVARVVRWFGDLTVTPPGATVSCMVTLASQVTFVFRSAGGARLATAAVPSEPANGCDAIAFSIGRELQDPLIDTTAPKDAFVTRVERLLGVCFGAGPEKVSPSCNKAWAAIKAGQLLHRLVLPPGTQALAREPRGDGGLLRRPQSTSGGSELVDRYRFWRVHDSLGAAEAFVEQHEPHARQTGSGTAGGPGVPANGSVTLTYVARNTLVSSRQVEVTFVSLPGGWTGIRADAQVVWIYPRTDAQMAPSNSRVIEVTSGSISRRITNYRTIDRISLRFDRLEVVQPGTTYHCPARVSGPPVTIEFRSPDDGNGRAVATGTGYSTQCSPIRYEAHGHRALLVGRDFVEWLQGVLGVRFR